MLTGFWIDPLLPRKSLWLVITFSFLNFEWFLLHSVWYLFAWICIWFRFYSHNQGQSLNSLFANILSNKSAVNFTNFYLKIYYVVVKLLRREVLVGSSQLIFPKLQPLRQILALTKSSALREKFLFFSRFLVVLTKFSFRW